MGYSGQRMSEGEVIIWIRSTNPKGICLRAKHISKPKVLKLDTLQTGDE